MPGFVIAGTHSGCGKTTVTLGLLAALVKRGLSVQPFKAGPDFIDPGLHRLVTGRPSRNLDVWMCGEDYVQACYGEYSRQADISVVEGVMGLYDGDHGTARLARLLELPVVLVVDAYGMAESAGAVVKGFTEYGGRPSFLGVLFNRVASESHFRRLKDSIAAVPVLGYLPRDLGFEIPHRHLGLIVAEENPVTKEQIDRLAETVLRHVDVEKIIRDSRQAAADRGDETFTIQRSQFNTSPPALSSDGKVTIAVAYDRAFCFYYEDNLDMLRDEGAEIALFSPLSDGALPAGADALYLGGGYPELYAGELSQNASLLQAIRDWAKADRPVYAECGGLMYLSRGIHDFEGRFFPLCGVLPFETEMKTGRSRLGYRAVEFREDCLLGRRGDRARGHEFHYSLIRQDRDRQSEGDDPDMIYRVSGGRGEDRDGEGYRLGNTLASYIHLHFGSNGGIAAAMIRAIKEARHHGQ